MRHHSVGGHPGSGATMEVAFDRDLVMYRVGELARIVVDTPDLELEEVLSQCMVRLREAFEGTPFTHIRLTVRDEARGDQIAESMAQLSSPVLIRGNEEGRVILASTELPKDVEFDSMTQGMIAAVGTKLSLILEHQIILTEYDELQRQLRHADRLATLGQLAAGVAHELNEPLGSILGYAQLAKKVDKVPDQAVGDLDRIIDAALDAREVIRKLLLFARQMPAERTYITLDRVVEEGLWFFESRCQDQGIELIRDLGNQEKTILADETQLRQVLVNLVVNAMQSMPEGGKLMVRTWEDDSEAVLEVADTGVGMEESLIEQIFVPFFTSKEVDEGTGLGLAIVHGIVKAHAGEIRVDSRPGVGSRFMVHIPFAEEGEVQQ